MLYSHFTRYAYVYVPIEENRSSFVVHSTHHSRLCHAVVCCLRGTLPSRRYLTVMFYVAMHTVAPHLQCEREFASPVQHTSLCRYSYQAATHKGNLTSTYVYGCGNQENKSAACETEGNIKANVCARKITAVRRSNTRRLGAGSSAWETAGCNPAFRTRSIARTLQQGGGGIKTERSTDSIRTDQIRGIHIIHICSRG